MIRRYLAAYLAARRHEVEALLADDFTFTSPQHGRIDRAAYFARCWPVAGTFRVFTLRQIVECGDAGVVLYEAEAADGTRIRNVERVAIVDGRIHSVEAFFGHPAGGAGAPRAEARVRAVVEAQARAIRCKNAERVIALNAPDLHVFDLVAPLHRHGAAAVRDRLRGWFDAFDGPLGCTVHALEVAVAGDVAFAHFLQHVSGTNTDGGAVDLWLQATLGLRERDGAWRIVHEHLSEPLVHDAVAAIAHGRTHHAKADEA